jgi:hypothetical protein
MIYISSGTDITTDEAVTGYTTEDINDAPLWRCITLWQTKAADHRLLNCFRHHGATPAGEISNIEKLSLLCLQPGFTPTTETSLNGPRRHWPSLA